MRSTTFALTLAMTAAASADLYVWEFTAIADFVGPVTGQLTLDLDELGAGSFLGTVGTNFGPASAGYTMPAVRCRTSVNNPLMELWTSGHLAPTTWF